MSFASLVRRVTPLKVSSVSSSVFRSLATPVSRVATRTFSSTTTPLATAAAPAEAATATAKNPEAMQAESYGYKFTIGQPSIFVPSGSDIFRDVHFPVDSTVDNKNNCKELRDAINTLFHKHKPSNHPFWDAYINAAPVVVKDPEFVTQFYHRYQSVMHATRVSVYFTPYLDSPKLRQRKIAILLDDDNVEINSHHKQLENLFRSMGATPMDEEEYNDVAQLCTTLDKETGRICTEVDHLYRQSTGAWLIAEVLSDVWISSLCRALKAHFPDAPKQQYFDEIFTGHVEIVHMLETLSLSEAVLARYPHLTKPTIEHAQQMGVLLDNLWDNLLLLLREYEKKHGVAK